MKKTYNKLTCLFGHHQYSEELTKDKHENSIHLCEVCKRSGYRKFSAEEEVRHSYDEEGNLIHSKWSDDSEIWYDYDDVGARIHTKWNNGSEVWYKYDEFGVRVYEKYSGGEESWRASNGCWVTKKPKNWKYEKQIQ